MIEDLKKKILQRITGHTEVGGITSLDVRPAIGQIALEFARLETSLSEMRSRLSVFEIFGKRADDPSKPIQITCPKCNHKFDPEELC